MLQHATKPAGMGGGDDHRWKDQGFRGDHTCWLEPKLAAAPALQACIDALLQLQLGELSGSDGGCCMADAWGSFLSVVIARHAAARYSMKYLSILIQRAALPCQSWRCAATMWPEGHPSSCHCFLVVERAMVRTCV